MRLLEWPRCAALWAAAALLLLQAAPASAAGGSCLGDFPALFRLLPGEASEEMMLAYRAYNPRARNGVVAILGADDAADALDPTLLDNILDIFGRGVEIRENPLRTDEGLFEVVAELTDVMPDGSMRMREGLVETIKDLANKGAGDDGVLFYQGAAFDLYMARQLRSGGSDVAALQRRLNVGATGRTRVGDLIEPCSACPGDVGFIQHENKNWTTELIGPFDGRLAGLVDQFQRDIIIHASSRMQTWRLNLREVARGQKDMIRDELLKQFDSKLVTDTLSPAAIANARDKFLELWEDGTIVRFY